MLGIGSGSWVFEGFLRICCCLGEPAAEALGIAEVS